MSSTWFLPLEMFGFQCEEFIFCPVRSEKALPLWLFSQYSNFARRWRAHWFSSFFETWLSCSLWHSLFPDQGLLYLVTADPWKGFLIHLQLNFTSKWQWKRLKEIMLVCWFESLVWKTQPICQLGLLEILMGTLSFYYFLSMLLTINHGNNLQVKSRKLSGTMLKWFCFL